MVFECLIKCGTVFECLIKCVTAMHDNNADICGETGRLFTAAREQGHEEKFPPNQVSHLQTTKNNCTESALRRERECVCVSVCVCVCERERVPFEYVCYGCVCVYVY